MTAKQASDPTERFFEQLDAHGDEPLLRKASGCTRFDIVDGRRTRRWFVRVERGHVSVTHTAPDVHCVIRVQKPLFDKLVTGKLNAVAAVLRGDIEVEGDWSLLVRMQRLFPGPSRGRRAKA